MTRLPGDPRLVMSQLDGTEVKDSPEEAMRARYTEKQLREIIEEISEGRVR